LESLADDPPGRVLIHDAARPFPDASLIGRVLDALRSHAGAIPALAVPDSLKRIADGLIADAPARDGLWRAQTPQGLRYDAILDAHRRAAASGRAGYTDDAAVAVAAGLGVAAVPGDEDNFKITAAGDLARAERLIAGAAELRIGQGFDAHAFDPALPGPVRL